MELGHQDLLPLETTDRPSGYKNPALKRRTDSGFTETGDADQTLMTMGDMEGDLLSEYDATEKLLVMQ